MVYANIKGNYVELGDNDAIEDMVPEQFMIEKIAKENESYDFVLVKYQFNDYLLHISQIQYQYEN